MTDLRPIWAARLVELRKAAGLTQEQVAEKLGISQQAVLEWEKARTTPTSENQRQLVILLNADRDYLFPLEVA